MDLYRNEPDTGTHVGDAAHQAADYMRSHSMDEMADDVRDKVAEVTNDVRDKADEVVGSVRDKADEVGTHTAAKINDVISGTGQKMSGLGQAIRNRTSKNRADKAAKATADALERSGRYLEEQDVNGIRGSLEKIIRRYPIQALLISAVVSFVLGRKMLN